LLLKGKVPEGRNIVIFSPQRWNHLYISKQHYALALARNNRVWFISAPEETPGMAYRISYPVADLPLTLVSYKVILPDICKFKMPGLYKKVTAARLRSLVKQLAGKVDVCIDFGCYQFFNNLDFIDAEHKIYFPVDDFENLVASKRGARYVFSVSTNIIDKFGRHGVPVSFINHGLADAFAKKAVSRLERASFPVRVGGKLRFGYSGNLFIRFLDIPVLQQLVERNPGVEFHFFGDTAFNAGNQQHAKWNNFLHSMPNIKLHGFVTPEALADAYEDLDGFVLCYKPDYKDYHGENSHKVFEYLSGGKVVVSTHLTLYANSPLLNCSPKDRNDLLLEVFADTIANLDRYNSAVLQQQRIELALDNTYAKQLGRIAETAGINGLVC
jgi:hypothetical protein